MAYVLRKMQILVTTLLITATGTVLGECEDSTPAESCGSDCCESCGQFFIDASVLYLRPFEGGLSGPCDSTQIFDTTVDNVVTSTLYGNSHDPHFKWDLGYRVGVGYEFADCNCGIEASWTHFNSTAGSGSSDNEHHWKINFDVVDLLFGCEYNWSDCFVLTPFAGIRGAKIDQKLRTHFVSTLDGVVTSTASGHLKESFSGIGPLFGVDGDFGVGCGFSFYGDFSVAFLYGTYHVKSNVNNVFAAGANIDYLKKNTQACQYVVDAGFGIRWKTCFCDDRLIIVQLGLEQHRYFNHNQFCGYGDLSLDGGSLSIGLEF